MPLTGETSGGEAGRSISSASRYITTTSLISISRCSASHSRVQKVARRCCATSSGEAMRPDGVRMLPSVMSQPVRLRPLLVVIAYWRPAHRAPPSVSSAPSPPPPR
jgi:hypothetical protein